MSDDYLIVIPTDPYWQPSRSAADRAAAVLSGTLPNDIARRGMEVEWHDSIEVVDCGANLMTISCRYCGADIPSWFGTAVSERRSDGFSSLMVTVPCCNAGTSLNDLAFDWPMGFAKFAITVLYPNRAWLSETELNSVADALGHPLRQILRHI